MKIFISIIISLIIIGCDYGQPLVFKKSTTITKIEDGYPQMPDSLPGQIFKHTYFHYYYNENLVASYWVAYILTKEMVKNVNLPREDMQFVPDPLLKQSGLKYALSSDYSRSGYDRGHLCPNGDFNFDLQAMTETFYLSNIVPQEPSMNRGIWAKLEDKVRDWAVANDSVYVIVGNIFTNNPKRIGKNQVAVPKWMYKIVFDISKKDGYKMIGFVMENTDYDHQAFYQYAVPVSKIEELTGIKFFPNLDSSLLYLKSKLILVKWQ